MFYSCVDPERKFISSKLSVTMSSQTPKKAFLCIHCKHPCCELHSFFKDSGCLRIQHCENCNHPVDKYIEYDVTLRLLDLMLLNKLVWRHTLYNQDLGFLHWKLAAVCLFCDGYVKWVKTSHNTSFLSKEQSGVFQAAKQIELYVLTFISLLELLVFVFLMVILCWMLLIITSRSAKSLAPCIQSWAQWFPHEDVNVETIIRCLLLSNAGKLLFVPTIIWSENESEFYLYVVVLYVYACNAMALSTALRSSFFVSLVTVLISSRLTTFFVLPLSNWLQSLQLHT